MKNLKFTALSALLTSALLYAAPASALVWAESDAGDSLTSAEVTRGAGLPSLDGITGNLTSTNVVGVGASYQVDLFKIFIADAALFSASAVSPTEADTAMFLFDGMGQAIYSNDDFNGSLLSTLPAGVAVSSGHYFLGIGLTGSFALNSLSEDLFLPDGMPAGLGPLASWFATPGTEEQLYGYSIALTGASVAAVPEPAAALLLLLGVGGLAATRTLRRQRAA